MLTMPLIGWRGTYVAIGVVIAATVMPLACRCVGGPRPRCSPKAEEATRIARADVGISPRLLVALLVIAGFSCCVAMAMPQVHIVAYCGDLGYGVARGAEMLSLMMFLGIARASARASWPTRSAAPDAADRLLHAGRSAAALSAISTD